MIKATKYYVQQGDDGASIAAQFGFRTFSKILDHPENVALRARRTNGNQLFPGDVVFVPELVPKYLALNERAENRFVLRVPRREVRVMLTDSTDTRGWNGLDYVVLDDCDVLASGQVGSDGSVQFEIASNIREVKLRVGAAVFPIHVGGLNPLRNAPDGGMSGCAQRLASLGYSVGSPNGSDWNRLSSAILAFKKQAGVDAPESAALDEALFSALERRYGQ